MEDDLLRPPRPRPGDLLFRHDLPDSHNNACLNQTWAAPRIGYTEGYRRGARLLVEHVIENQRDQDYLVYPIIFLYRHHIELALKNIILRAPFLIDRPLTDVERGHLGKHRLDWLWQDLKPMFAEICKAAGWGALDPADIEGIDEYVRQFSALDPDSYRFRYAQSKRGEPSLPADVKWINLRHFAETIERCADYLDALDAATSHLEEVKTEMEAEWRSDMAQYMDYG